MKKILLLLGLCLNLSCQGQNQKLEISPSIIAPDEVASIKINGLKPGQKVILRSEAEDLNRRKWTAIAEFHADKQGMIDLSEKAPHSGSYKGANPMGLVQFLSLPDGEAPQIRFASDAEQKIAIGFFLDIDGQAIESGLLTIDFQKSSLQNELIENEPFKGRLFLPDDDKKYPAIIVLSGSDGGWGSVHNARLLASKGFIALALPYFGVDGLPQSLDQISVNYFQSAIDWLEKHDRIIKDKIGILGKSKGGEAALLLASYDARIKAVVGNGASGLIWGCVCSNGTSSWSYNGSPLPYIKSESDPNYQRGEGELLNIGINYKYRIKKAGQAIKKYEIPVEKINGPVLLISGKKDDIWPSFQLSEMVMNRLAQNQFPHEFQHLSYENAGHSISSTFLPVRGTNPNFRGTLTLGGTLEGNAEASRDSWPKVLAFFERHLK